MSDIISSNQRKIYLAVIAIWLILLVGLMSAIVVFDLQRARTLFFQSADQQHQEVTNRVYTIESILEGFAAMISVTLDLDERQRIRRYAQEMLDKYPYIFMFEIVQKVPHDKISSFIQYYRQNIDQNFEIKGFSYESDRHWQPMSEQLYHLPIVFMEPFPEESRKVLGLDLSSNSFFRQALQKSEVQNEAVSSAPFKLVEGYLGYIIHRPITTPHLQTEYLTPDNEENLQYAVLVIRADTLLDKHPQLLAGMRELLYNAAFSEANPKGHLLQRGERESSWVKSMIFPHLRVRMDVGSASQPFVLLVEQQLGWGVISWGKLGFSLLAALFTFGIMLAYARLYFQSEMARANRYLQISKAMIIGLDRNGNVNLINPRACEILGYSKAELIGRNWFENVVPEHSRDEVYKDFLRIVAGEIVPLKTYENDILTKNGETRHIDWNNDIETNEKGVIIGTLSSGQDVTERKRAEEAMLRQQREMAHFMRVGTMGEMATGMAHELNQPLTALVSYCGTARTLIDSLVSPPKQITEILSGAIEQAHRAAEIIRHLREFVDKTEKELEIFDLNKMIVDVITLLKWEIREGGAKIQFFPDKRPCKVKARKIEIEQVLLNLLRNSLESIRDRHKGDRVIVRTRLSANDTIEVTVTDNGPGIDAHIADRLFQPFQTTKKSGMGIGLSLSRTLIEANDGILWVDKSFTDGASFGFALSATD